MRQISLTTWLVLALCVLVGVVAVAMTVLVVVRLNRQVLASAAELRAGLSVPTTPVADQARAELLAYAGRRAAVESQWASQVAEYRLRYPNDAIYGSVVTAQTVRQVNAMPRPASVAPLHERWAQAWSDRDAAFALLAKPDAAPSERDRANELARKAADELRRIHNDLQDQLVAQGATEQEITTALGPFRAGG
jgi:hypothetical protein